MCKFREGSLFVWLILQYGRERERDPFLPSTGNVAVWQAREP